MSVSFYQSEGVVLGAAAAVIGSITPASTKRVIVSAFLVNTTAAPVDASVYLVPAGGAPAAATIAISTRTIAPKETYFCPELINQGIGQGGSVQALGTGLTFRYSARDITNG